jgi:hypothetical protein
MSGAPQRVDFAVVNAAALGALPTLLARWLPDGHQVGVEWVARNPRRADRRPGSFKVNIRTGRWADFATGNRGGDPISLAAYLSGLSQVDAARQLGQALGVLS